MFHGEGRRRGRVVGEGKHECRVSVQTQRPLCSPVPPSPPPLRPLIAHPSPAFSPSSRGGTRVECATPASLHNTHTGHPSVTPYVHVPPSLRVEPPRALETKPTSGQPRPFGIEDTRESRFFLSIENNSLSFWSITLERDEMCDA